MSRTDTDLLLWAVRHCGDDAAERKARWSHVARQFGLGSTGAIKLCRRAECDPDESVGGCLCEADTDSKCPLHDCWCEELGSSMDCPEHREAAQ